MLLVCKCYMKQKWNTNTIISLFFVQKRCMCQCVCGRDDKMHTKPPRKQPARGIDMQLNSKTKNKTHAHIVDTEPNG